MKKKIAPIVEYVAESASACLVTMVQGNLLAIGLSHMLIASQTGVIAGLATTVGILIARTNKRWIISLMLGVTTGVVDFFVHPGMFGTAATEAVVTGTGAAALSYLVGTAIQYIRSRKAATD